jgi:hypothetical protein
MMMLAASGAALHSAVWSRPATLLDTRDAAARVGKVRERSTVLGVHLGVHLVY